MLINPFITNIFVDSCALDNPYNNENQITSALLNNKDLNIVIAHSNIKEINHPNTPQRTKDMAIVLIHTISNNPVLSESELEARILDILAGNGKRKKI